MVVTEEPKDRYLTHYASEIKTKTTKPAKPCKLKLFGWMKDRGMDLSPELIGSDTTNYMSGWKGGIVHYLKEFINRRIFRSFCCLHINKLPFGHIVAELDGPTLSDRDGVVRLVSYFLKMRLNSEILLFSLFHFSNILLILAKLLLIK